MFHLRNAACDLHQNLLGARNRVANFVRDKKQLELVLKVNIKYTAVGVYLEVQTSFPPENIASEFNFKIITNICNILNQSPSKQ